MSIETAEMTWVLINRAADLMRSDAFRHDGGELNGVTMSQQNVLGVVYVHRTDGVMVKDIASELNITRGAASQTVDALVKLGFLERATSERDRRAVFVRTTKKGAAIRKMLSDRLNPILEDIFASVKVKDLESFMRVLQILVERLSKLNAASKDEKKSLSHSTEE